MSFQLLQDRCEPGNIKISLILKAKKYKVST